MNMNPFAFSSERFIYNKYSKTFSTEASTLTANGNFLSRLYSDACDEGFVMVSAKTGKFATFFLIHTNTDKEGDITSWEFYPTRESIIDNPGLDMVKVIVFND